MQIAVLILLLVIAALLWRNAFRPRFLPAVSDEWLVLEWHAILHADDVAKRTLDNDALVHIQFVPIIAWKYDHYGYKYGKPTPVTPPAYQVQNRLDTASKYETMSYWLRDGAVFDISDYWSHAGDFWENLSGYAIAGTKIELHGSVPSCYQRKLSEIVSMADQRHDKRGT